MRLLNPKEESFKHLDQESQDIMKKTIAFFEAKGKTKLTEDYHAKVWYGDFIEFIKNERIFARLLTPEGYGKKDCRWDTARICDFNEILGFYGLPYWYTWQVTILGLGPIWMGKNEEKKRETAQRLEDGDIFAFGLSEKEHGADLYSSEMTLTPMGEGTYMADGGKYYIGNANKAGLVSIFAKDSDTDEYVFFTANPTHANYDLVKNVVSNQSYVAEFGLSAYPVTEADILSKGDHAWDSALNTINVGKYNLGWAAIGICTHAFFEAITHASERSLYGKHVTDFPHVKHLMTDAWSRLFAMKLFARRNADYMRTASKDDRRYLLYNPLTKMKVTTQGEEVINLLWDVIAAKGFEKDTYFTMAAIEIRGLPKLEGTVHVNMALIVKFMANYFFAPADMPDVPTMDQPGNDDFLFNQGTTHGLSKTLFHDFEAAYTSLDLPNIAVFKEQINALKSFLVTTPPEKSQTKDIDFLLIMGELFALVVYGQLIIENAQLRKVADDVIDQIFDFMVRDFSKYALQLYSKESSTQGQMKMSLAMIKKPKKDLERFTRVWETHVLAMSNRYAMNL
ncbi:Acd9 [Desulforapulum autotrophicum HRM2]|uniref:Acd9 n=1 Tax=Desulforapulum autotrophicum (strain ATCC 43914 / DSM 3382 / VKM B-1955 / HRM2) TaxID=177437 RepID=C0QI66_DESAH|nr:acyl-CoA dehydrogenase family protein [Desulforapulum autotrophicum]ACN15802.1 Acd9 [Desulforapulum autotrophicum HRM2]